MAGPNKSSHPTSSREGNVRNTGKLHIWGALALLGAGLVAAGCKSAPPLSQADALTMIQAKYDQSAPVNTDIVVNDLGMRQGVTAKYWEGVKKYPNGYWADFKLTPDGKKLVKLASNGDTIEWRPEGPSDDHYMITITTVAANHVKARDVQDIEDVGDTKVVAYTEDVNLAGLPDPLQGIAHNPGNELSTTRHATFAVDGGAWKLQSIQ
jgi:hypothetical protein